MVCIPINITPEFVQKLLEQITALTKQNVNLTVHISELTAKITDLQKTIKELEEKKNKNSKNSSKPPSSDGYSKKPVSLRGKSGKKQGGQEGHKGTNLAQRKPDMVVGCMPSKCAKCKRHKNHIISSGERYTVWQMLFTFSQVCAERWLCLGKTSHNHCHQNKNGTQ